VSESLYSLHQGVICVFPHPLLSICIFSHPTHLCSGKPTRLALAAAIVANARRLGTGASECTICILHIGGIPRMQAAGAVRCTGAKAAVTDTTAAAKKYSNLLRHV